MTRCVSFGTRNLSVRRRELLWQVANTALRAGPSVVIEDAIFALLSRPYVSTALTTPAATDAFASCIILASNMLADAVRIITDDSTTAQQPSAMGHFHAPLLLPSDLAAARCARLIQCVVALLASTAPDAALHSHPSRHAVAPTVAAVASAVDAVRALSAHVAKGGATPTHSLPTPAPLTPLLATAALCVTRDAILAAVHRPDRQAAGALPSTLLRWDDLAAVSAAMGRSGRGGAPAGDAAASAGAVAVVADNATSGDTAAAVAGALAAFVGAASDIVHRAAVAAAAVAAGLVVPRDEYLRLRDGGAGAEAPRVAPSRPPGIAAGIGDAYADADSGAADYVVCAGFGLTSLGRADSAPLQGGRATTRVARAGTRRRRFEGDASPAAAALPPLSLPRLSVAPSVVAAAATCVGYAVAGSEQADTAAVAAYVARAAEMVAASGPGGSPTAAPSRGSLRRDRGWASLNSSAAAAAAGSETLQAVGVGAAGHGGFALGTHAGGGLSPSGTTAGAYWGAVAAVSGGASGAASTANATSPTAPSGVASAWRGTRSGGTDAHPTDGVGGRPHTATRSPVVTLRSRGPPPSLARMAPSLLVGILHALALASPALPLPSATITAAATSPLGLARASRGHDVVHAVWGTALDALGSAPTGRVRVPVLQSGPSSPNAPPGADGVARWLPADAVDAITRALSAQRATVAATVAPAVAAAVAAGAPGWDRRAYVDAVAAACEAAAAARWSGDDRAPAHAHGDSLRPPARGLTRTSARAAGSALAIPHPAPPLAPLPPSLVDAAPPVPVTVGRPRRRSGVFVSSVPSAAPGLPSTVPLRSLAAAAVALLVQVAALDGCLVTPAVDTGRMRAAYERHALRAIVLPSSSGPLGTDTEGGAMAPDAAIGVNAPPHRRVRPQVRTSTASARVRGELSRTAVQRTARTARRPRSMHTTPRRVPTPLDASSAAAASPSPRDARRAAPRARGTAVAIRSTVTTSLPNPSAATAAALAAPLGHRAAKTLHRAIVDPLRILGRGHRRHAGNGALGAQSADRGSDPWNAEADGLRLDTEHGEDPMYEDGPALRRDAAYAHQGAVYHGFTAAAARAARRHFVVVGDSAMVAICGHLPLPFTLPMAYAAGPAAVAPSVAPPTPPAHSQPSVGPREGVGRMSTPTLRPAMHIVTNTESAGIAVATSARPYPSSGAPQGASPTCAAPSSSTPATALVASMLAALGTSAWRIPGALRALSLAHATAVEDARASAVAVRRLLSSGAVDGPSRTAGRGVRADTSALGTHMRDVAPIFTHGIVPTLLSIGIHSSPLYRHMAAILAARGQVGASPLFQSVPFDASRRQSHRGRPDAHGGAGGSARQGARHSVEDTALVVVSAIADIVLALQLFHPRVLRGVMSAIEDAAATVGMATVTQSAMRAAAVLASATSGSAAGLSAYTAPAGGGAASRALGGTLERATGPSILAADAGTSAALGGAARGPPSQLRGDAAAAATLAAAWARIGLLCVTATVVGEAATMAAATDAAHGLAQQGAGLAAASSAPIDSGVYGSVTRSAALSAAASAGGRAAGSLDEWSVNWIVGAPRRRAWYVSDWGAAGMSSATIAALKATVGRAMDGLRAINGVAALPSRDVPLLQTTLMLSRHTDDTGASALVDLCAALKERMRADVSLTANSVALYQAIAAVASSAEVAVPTGLPRGGLQAGQQGAIVIASTTATLVDGVGMSGLVSLKERATAATAAKAAAPHAAETLCVVCPVDIRRTTAFMPVLAALPSASSMTWQGAPMPPFPASARASPTHPRAPNSLSSLSSAAGTRTRTPPAHASPSISLNRSASAPSSLHDVPRTTDSSSDVTRGCLDALSVWPPPAWESMRYALVNSARTPAIGLGNRGGVDGSHWRSALGDTSAGAQARHSDANQRVHLAALLHGASLARVISLLRSGVAPVVLPRDVYVGTAVSVAKGSVSGLDVARLLRDAVLSVGDDAL